MGSEEWWLPPQGLEVQEEIRLGVWFSTVAEEEDYQLFGRRLYRRRQGRGEILCHLFIGRSTVGV